MHTSYKYSCCETDVLEEAQTTDCVNKDYTIDVSILRKRKSTLMLGTIT